MALNIDIVTDIITASDRNLKVNLYKKLRVVFGLQYLALRNVDVDLYDSGTSRMNTHIVGY